MKTSTYLALTINERINYRAGMKRNGFVFSNPMIIVFAVIKKGY